ncbi:lactonase family protein [Schlesneria sp.]|uniref:lactonase family protein n=1 Tax=Schlesneria sp. TaxID=2762018 RepID=UPI002EED68A4
MNLIRPRSLFALLMATMLNPTISTVTAEQPVVLVSSFAPGKEGGIQAYELDLQSGSLKATHRTGDISNPFFFAISRDGKFLYTIDAKTFGGEESEHVSAFALDGTTGRMKFLNRQSTRGTASCFVDVDATGKSVLVANYSTGNIASFPTQADGSLKEAATFIQHSGSSVDPVRQKGPYAHCLVVSPDNRFAFAADLGIDQVLGYQLDPATAKLVPNTPPFVKSPAGAGPRHLTFHPNGRYVYVINELNNSVTLFDYDTKTGTLKERQNISTLPSDFKGVTHCADLKITPDGRFLYGTNRGHDSIAAYQLGADGEMTLIGIEPSLGKGPQNLLITPDGKLLLCANMPGNNVAVFKIDGQSGKLKSVGEPISQVSPACIRLLP